MDSSSENEETLLSQDSLSKTALILSDNPVAGGAIALGAEIGIIADNEAPCPNEIVTFIASDVTFHSLKDPETAPINWSGGEDPPTGQAQKFATRFRTPGEKRVIADWTTLGVRATAVVNVKTLSGRDWVNQFMGSRDLETLEPTFRDKVEQFIAAIKSNKNAFVEIKSTFRPPQRQYMMHNAYAIARQNVSPETIPPMNGVNICWAHRAQDGLIDFGASKSHAEEMVLGFAIEAPPANPPPDERTSRHCKGLAVDMKINWAGDLRMVDKDGSVLLITSTPRDGTNSELQAVGKTYGVINDPTDAAGHWSFDGN